MKLLELHISGRMIRGDDDLGPKVGNVDLWRIMETASGIAMDKNVILTLTVEEIEESAAPTAVLEETVEGQAE